MNKIQQDLFDFFSNKETYKRTEKLIESFQEFQQDLFVSFWDKLAKHVTEYLNIPEWKVCHETHRINKGTSRIFISHVNDERYLLYFQIYCTKDELIYGLDYEHNSNPLDINSIYNEAHIDKFKEEGWEFGSIEKGWMPLYYDLDAFNFKSNKVFEKFLADQIDITISQISDKIFKDFSEDIQGFIIRKLKDKGVIK